MLGGAPQKAGNCGCGGHLGLQGWRRAVGMGCMHAWAACAAHARVLLAILGTRGGGGLWAVGRLHLRGSGGRALDDGKVATPTLVTAADPPDSCRTSSPPRKCEHRVEIQLVKVPDLCRRRQH